MSKLPILSESFSRNSGLVSVVTFIIFTNLESVIFCYDCNKFE